MSENALLAIALLAGILLCGAVIVTASRRYRRDGDVKKLLVSLIAAIVALVFGFIAQLVVWIGVYQVAASFSGVTASDVLLAYFSGFLSVPAGMARGWALSLLGSPTNAPGQARAPGFIVGGLAYSLFATTALAVAVLAGRLIRYGHNGTVGVPDLAAAFVFLGLMMLLAVRVTSNFRNMSVGVALRLVGVGFGSSAMLALGVFIAAVAVDSLRRFGAPRRSMERFVFLLPVLPRRITGARRSFAFLRRQNFRQNMVPAVACLTWPETYPASLQGDQRIT